jgi:hypothetical protein
MDEHVLVDQADDGRHDVAGGELAAGETASAAAMPKAPGNTESRAQSVRSAGVHSE